MRNSKQHLITERCGWIWKTWCKDVLLPVTDAFRSRLSGKYCRLGSWRWRITKNDWLHHCIDKTERIVNHHEYQLHWWNLLQWYRREEQLQSVLEKRKMMASSSQEPRATGKFAAMFLSGNEGTGKSIQFSFQNGWSVKYGKISSWRQ